MRELEDELESIPLDGADPPTTRAFPWRHAVLLTTLAVAIAGAFQFGLWSGRRGAMLTVSNPCPHPVRVQIARPSNAPPRELNVREVGSVAVPGTLPRDAIVIVDRGYNFHPGNRAASDNVISLPSSACRPPEPRTALDFAARSCAASKPRSVPPDESREEDTERLRREASDAQRAAERDSRWQPLADGWRVLVDRHDHPGTISESEVHDAARAVSAQCAQFR